MNKFIFNCCMTLATTALAIMLLATPTFAATNQALGSIAGVSADLSDSNTVTLYSQGLALVKRAFLTDGTALDGGQTAGGEETLPSGTTIRFLIYVNNATDLDVADVRVTDDLSTSGFSFVSGGLFHEANVLNACATATCTTAEEAALLTSISGNVANQRGEGTADADSMSYDSGTFIVSAGTPNGTAITANATSTWGMVFEVTLD